MRIMIKIQPKVPPKWWLSITNCNIRCLVDNIEVTFHCDLVFSLVFLEQILKLMMNLFWIWKIYFYIQFLKPFLQFFNILIIYFRMISEKSSLFVIIQKLFSSALISDQIMNGPLNCKKLGGFSHQDQKQIRPTEYWLHHSQTYIFSLTRQFY